MYPLIVAVGSKPISHLNSSVFMIFTKAICLASVAFILALPKALTASK